MADGPLSVVINADDFGLARCVNDSVLEAARSGVVTSASLMVNMPFAEEALQQYTAIRAKYPDFQMSMGLHVCLTSGRPVSAPEDIPLLVGRDGMFCHGFIGLWRNLMHQWHSPSEKNKTFADQINHELQNQLARLDQWSEQYEFTPTHLDSHQHIHLLPSLFEMTQEAARKRSLLLRIPLEYYGSWQRWCRSLLLRFPTGIMKRELLAFLATRRKRYSSDGASSESSISNGYFGILDTGHLDRASLKKILSVIPALSARTKRRTFEINIHPWQVNSAMKDELCCSVADDQFATSPWRQQEFLTVTEFRTEFHQMAKDIGIILIPHQQR